MTSTKPITDVPEHSGKSYPGFIPVASNADIEREYKNKTKGAFTDEARLKLAYAVKKRRKRVLMDGHDMHINYAKVKDLVWVQRDRAFVPCGYFSYTTLNNLIEAHEAEVA
jgi:hypothetical protein